MVQSLKQIQRSKKKNRIISTRNIYNLDIENNEDTFFPILYPPTLIGHITEDIADLYRKRAETAIGIDIYFGIQLNGEPHLGTGITIMLAYAIGNHLRNEFKKPVTIKFGALENGPGTKEVHNNITYQRMLKDVKDEKGNMVSEKYLRIFIGLLQELSKITEIPFQIETYEEMQKNFVARKTLLKIFQHEEIMINLLNPSDKNLRTRFPCPKCGLADKHAQKLQRILHKKGKQIAFLSFCPHHGRYHNVIKEKNNDFVDVNTMIRNVMKEAKIIDDSGRRGTFPLIVKGTDWTHSATLVSNALEHLGYSYFQRPDRIFTPIIEDWSGAKLSKSIYVGDKIYSKIPQEFILLKKYQEKFGRKGFNALYEEVNSWVKDPKKLYRNYSIAGLQRLLKKRGIEHYE